MTLKPLRSCVGIYQNAYYQKEITCCNFSREGLSHWRKAHQISHEKVEEQLERLPDLKSGLLIFQLISTSWGINLVLIALIAPRAQIARYADNLRSWDFNPRSIVKSP